jgi:hypothetical protein
VSRLGAHSLPAQTSQTLPAFPAYYDAHKDVVVVTDAFPKPAAGMFDANFAPSLSVVKPASQPAWYVVHGKAAAGQLAVLGSEPGESDYSPLWRTVIVTWKPGVTPKVLTSDNMILSLAKRRADHPVHRLRRQRHRGGQAIAPRDRRAGAPLAPGAGCQRGAQPCAWSRPLVPRQAAGRGTRGRGSQARKRTPPWQPVLAAGSTAGVAFG